MSIAGGEIALSVFLEFFAKLASYDPILNFVTEKQVIQQLKEWQKILPSIKAVLNDAEEKQMKDPNVKIWLAKLQNLGYDVGDVSDEFAVEALHRKLHEDQASTSKAQKSIASWFTSFINSRAFMFNKKMISKLVEITARLNGLAREKGSLGLREIDESAMSKRMKASLQFMPLVDETHVYGREKERAEILELLLSNNRNENEASVIHIFGVGGIGKTTLAQLVYYDNSIKKSFNHKLWICVSKDFDATLVTKTILKSITDESCIVPFLDNLQAMLKEKLFGKSFLLVLDNVWNENYDDLAILLKPFGVGTKVIVTTRSCKVSSVVSSGKAYSLQQLSQKDCLSVFTQQAIKASDFSGHPELEKVGENIVKKCNGLPLAAKAIGGLLRTHVDYGVWKDISESKIWDLPEEQCGVIPALLLSYHHLPPYLKRCFAYCSLLPKDYEFEEEIILLWKAEGFLQQANSKTQIEDLGSQYFRDLVSRSFFQTSSRDKSRFVMHDLINDLAQLVSREICFKLEDDKQQKISEGTRHSSYVRGLYDGVKKFEAFVHMKRLRTFLPFMLPKDGACFITNTVLIDLLPKLRSLRVLSLQGYCITMLPNVFENLVHLRYLNFSYTLIKSLPDSVCTLYNLETLLLRESLLEKLPSETELLVNLNHLDITGAKMKGMPFGIGKLTNLHRLSNFILGAGDGHQIQEMKNLLHLKGYLSLSGLENIVEAQDAWEAKLIDKSGLDVLILMWSTNFGNNVRNEAVEEEVLNMLEPHRDLKELVIENYGGRKFPNWIADSSLKNLLSLNLNNCRNCKFLPSIGKLPLLKDLSIRGMHDVDKVGIEFYGENQSNAFASLERLCFEDMPEWKEWDFDEVVKFPCLREFCIVNCPQLLGRFPNSLYSLEKLVIRGCTQLVVSVSNLPLLYELEIDGCAELVLRDDADFPSLRKVSLSNISKFSSLTERLVSGLKSLEHLRISRCKELTSLSWKQLESVGQLRSLRSLEIFSFPQLVSLEPEEVEEEQLQLGKVCNIESLTIGNCEKLKRLPQDLHFLTFLTEMQIKECPCIVYFSNNNLPPALKRLVIKGCANLRCLVDHGENTSISNTCLLEHLEIVACRSLVSLSLPIRLQILIISKCSKLASLSSSGKLPVGLKQLSIKDCLELESVVQTIHDTSCLELLQIWSCRNIKSLPRGLNKLNHVQKIDILQCQSLVSLTEGGLPTTNLTSLRISGCQNLGNLPPNMQNLTALKELWLSDCSPHLSFAEEGFPINLTSLSISVPKLCSSLLKWGLHKLTSLKDLYINGEECPDVVTFPLEEGGMLPRSLTNITIQKFENLRNLSAKGFRNLTSLQELWILDCTNLESLPEKDVLLSVWKLYIWNSPLLTDQFILNQGPEWSKISHIPEVLANHHSVIPKASWTIQP